MSTVQSHTRHRRRLANWREVNDTRDDRIRDAHKAGMSEREIARVMGVSRTTVRTALHSKGENAA